MVEAAKSAGEEVAKADDSLEARLKAMEAGTTQLAEKLENLDRLALDAGKRTEALTYAIARVEEKLDQSQRTVDQAVRAGEMAAAAAGTTGDALKDAVSAALDGARDATYAIQTRTREASEEAARALAALRAAGEEAALSIRAAGQAARAETGMTERRATQMTGSLREGSGRDRRREAGGYFDDPEIHRERPRAEPPAPPPPQPAVPSDDVLFDRLGDPRLDTPPPRPDVNGTGGPDEFVLRQRLEDEPADGGALAPPVNGTVPANNDAAWGDILADIDTGEPERAAMPSDPEEGVQILITRLQESGIELPKTFRPRDKKKNCCCGEKRCR